MCSVQEKRSETACQIPTMHTHLHRHFRNINAIAMIEIRMQIMWFEHSNSDRFGLGLDFWCI
jgi:hypothetical protein